MRDRIQKLANGVAPYWEIIECLDHKRFPMAHVRSARCMDTSTHGLEVPWPLSVRVYRPPW